jgi:hypothetical protein
LDVERQLQAQQAASRDQAMSIEQLEQLLQQLRTELDAANARETTLLTEAAESQRAHEESLAEKVCPSLTRMLWTC